MQVRKEYKRITSCESKNVRGIFVVKGALKMFEDDTEADYLASRDPCFSETEQRQSDIESDEAMLSAMTDNELLDFICKRGKRLNTLPTFKSYDVAKRIRDNGWTPTRKQREALINTVAIALNS